MGDTWRPCRHILLCGRSACHHHAPRSQSPATSIVRHSSKLPGGRRGHNEVEHLHAVARARAFRTGVAAGLLHTHWLAAEDDPVQSTQSSVPEISPCFVRTRRARVMRVNYLAPRWHPYARQSAANAAPLHSCARQACCSSGIVAHQGLQMSN